MSAPRCPPNWTQEAADLVWRDWQAALTGRDVFVCRDLDLVGPAARLRAWAAVGAPVLAPAEDGRPSLAEWVHACESSALGRPTPGVTPGALWTLYFYRVEVVFIWRVEVVFIWPGTAWVSGHDIVTQRVHSPAALRAALDALAVRT